MSAMIGKLACIGYVLLESFTITDVVALSAFSEWAAIRFPCFGFRDGEAGTNLHTFGLVFWDSIFARVRLCCEQNVPSCFEA